MDRVQFVTHRGKRVLVIDASDCGPQELLAVFDQVEETVAAAPSDSLLILGDFSRARFDHASADRMKVVAARDTPHVHRSALVGADSIPEVYLRALESFSARKFPSFHTRAEALDWLSESEEDHGKAAAS